MAIPVVPEDEAKSPDSPISSSDGDTPQSESKQIASSIQEMAATDGRETWWSRLLRFFRDGPHLPEDDRYDHLKVKPIAGYPAGYSRYAAFIDTDDNFRIYRRFGTLRNRVLLHRQLELSLLEDELDELDQSDNNGARAYRLASIQYDKAQQDSMRTDLVERIDTKLEQYDTLLARERQSLAMEKPTKRNHLNLINYVWNTRMIAQAEAGVLNRLDDFVVLSRNQDSPFHTFLEDVLQKFPLPWIQRIFVSKVQEAKAEGSENAGINLFSKARISALIQVTVTIITVGLLMVPVCLLFKLKMADKIKVVLLLVFVLVFPIAISVFARPRHHELFAATAAYTAVLVVFLTNFAGSGSEDGG